MRIELRSLPAEAKTEWKQRMKNLEQNLHDIDRNSLIGSDRAKKEFDIEACPDDDDITVSSDFWSSLLFLEHDFISG